MYDIWSWVVAGLILASQEKKTWVFRPSLPNFLHPKPSLEDPPRIGALMLFSILFFVIISVFISLTTATLLDEESCILAGSAESDQQAALQTLLEIALRNRWKTCLKIIIEGQKWKGEDVKNMFDVENRIMLREMKEMKQIIDSQFNEVSIVTPALQWCQSANFIHLNVKFSHKLDAPATLNVESNNVSINLNQLFLEATDKKKIFKLDLELLRDINSSASTYSMGSVGRMMFSLKKADAPSRWPRLLLSKEKRTQVTQLLIPS